MNDTTAPTKPTCDRAEMIRTVLRMLAADPTATGATLVLPSGEVLTIDAESARAMNGDAPAKGGRA